MAGPPAPGKPVALVTVFSGAALERILATIAALPKPAVASWYVGTYGINEQTAARVKATPGCLYAPVFGIQPANSAAARKERPDPKAAPLDPAHTGEISQSSAVPPSPQDGRAWGVELGRRFRDQLRVERARQVRIDAWQFDEVLGQCRFNTAEGRSHRAFVGGVLRGLAEGRPRLGDRLERGFVWIATTALNDLPRLASGGADLFLADIDRASKFLVGEEYPVFAEGTAAAEGAKQGRGHRALVGSNDKTLRSLGGKYVVGMTPGFLAVDGLGGNHNASPEFVRTWRSSFINARIAGSRPRGLAQFNFVGANADAERLPDAVRSLHEAWAHSPH